jgi:hypothetical protein
LNRVLGDTNQENRLCKELTIRRVVFFEEFIIRRVFLFEEITFWRARCQ